jgi:hypothetical protein
VSGSATALSPMPRKPPVVTGVRVRTSACMPVTTTFRSYHRDSSAGRFPLYEHGEGGTGDRADRGPSANPPAEGLRWCVLDYRGRLAV